MIETAVLTALHGAMRDIAEEKGDFVLFGLFMRADGPGKPDLVVSAPWIERGDLDALRELAQLLSASIGPESLVLLSRIVVLDQGDPALDVVLSACSIDDGEVRVGRLNLGVEIEDAVILRAKRAA